MPVRQRRRPWSTLPTGVTLTLSDAAELLCVKRESLRSALWSKVVKKPTNLVVVKDNGRIVGVRLEGVAE